MLLSALLKKYNHQCDVLIESCEKDFLNSINKSKPDIIGFYCTTGLQNWIFKCSEKIKKQTSVPVIIGGPHPTFYPNVINNPYIDIICRGEGEYASLELMNTLKDNISDIVKIKNLWVKTKELIYRNELRDLIENLNELPFPDFNIYTKYRFLVSFVKERYPVITGRGCPYDCSFCYNHSLKKLYKVKGKYVRRRSVDNVLSELIQAKEKYGVNKFVFNDNDFLLDTKWLEAFSEQYNKKIKTQFICDARANSVNEDSIKILKKMGCICIKIGVESGNEQIRRKVLNKDITNEQIKRAAFIIKKYKINLKTCNILGIPLETISVALDTYRINKEIGSDFALCSLLQPYPGTQIGKYIIKINEESRHTESGLLKFDESCYQHSPIKLINSKEIINLQHLMRVFVKLRLPLFLVRIIIKFPLTKIYYLIFKLSFAYSTYKIERLKLIPCIRFARYVKSYV